MHSISFSLFVHFLLAFTVQISLPTVFGAVQGLYVNPVSKAHEIVNSASHDNKGVNFYCYSGNNNREKSITRTWLPMVIFH